MGRPKEHDDLTAAALLDAAERAVEAGGIDGLSLRGVAEAACTTTRAVYSLFGSKEGLITALGRRAFDILGADIQAMPSTDDPASDLVEAGTTVFRTFAITHPSLFRIGVQRSGEPGDSGSSFRATQREALAGLHARVARLDTVREETRGVADATVAFHALCEGLAAVELRGLLPAEHAERIWRDALTALVTGLTQSPAPRQPSSR
jgi:AcrR family transcriptional regulator